MAAAASKKTFSPLIFRQLFEKESSTYTYLLACEDTRDALLIDPVDLTSDRDLEIVSDLKLNLVKVLNTHVHAGKVTSLLNQRLLTLTPPDL